MKFSFMKPDHRDSLEIKEIRENLVNIALVVGVIAAFPLLLSSLIRITYFKFSIFWLSQAVIYTPVFIIMLFRKRLPYPVRAYTLIIAMLVLAILDFFETGFSSSGYIWLMASAITTAMFFSIRRTFVILSLSVITIFLIYVLYNQNLIHFIFYGTEIHYPLIAVIINTLLIVLIVSIISFGLQYIHKRLIHTIYTLEKEKINLEKTTVQLRNEIEARRNSELQVINSEKNFRNIFEQSSDAILIVDLNKRILDFNDELKNLTGLNEKQIFEKDVIHFLPRKLRKDYENFFNEPEQVPTRFDLKFEALHGKTRYIDCSTSLIRYNGEKAFLFMIRDLTERINLEKANFLISVAAEERERSRFSKELHDGLGPLLSTLKIYLEMFYSNPGDEETKKRINSTLTDSIKTVKEISNNLSPYVLENMGLNKAIESFIDKVKFSQKITVNFRSNFKGRVSQEIEISIFRIITELINNTLKYANAHNIEISLNKNNLIISLQYNDDGIGFDYDKIIEQKKGIGLFNLKSRIENFGGEITIFTSPGKGFKMNAYLNIT